MLVENSLKNRPTNAGEHAAIWAVRVFLVCIMAVVLLPTAPWFMYPLEIRWAMRGILVVSALGLYLLESLRRRV